MLRYCSTAVSEISQPQFRCNHQNQQLVSVPKFPEFLGRTHPCFPPRRAHAYSVSSQQAAGSSTQLQVVSIATVTILATLSLYHSGTAVSHGVVIGKSSRLLSTRLSRTTEHTTATGNTSQLWWQLLRHNRQQRDVAGSSSSSSQLRPIEWLHLPKTGTSLGNTLVLWACPELNSTRVWVDSESPKAPPSCLLNFKMHDVFMKGLPIGDHHSLTNRSEAELGRVMTMLRYPPARLASGYHWVKQVLEKDPRHMSTTEAQVCDWVRNSTWAHATRGMMVKMVAGEPMTWQPSIRKHDIDSRLPDDAMVEEACTRLRKFAFVGITDYWNASVCLFHALHGGRMHPVELLNVRKGEYTSVAGAVQEADCGDTADMRLFECGMQLFREMLHQHPQCKHYLTGTEAAQLSL